MSNFAITESVHQTEKSQEDLRLIIHALNKVQALIEFDPDGKVLYANDNFLKTFGYSLSEVQGKHHRFFCEDELHTSDDYKKFWGHLREGIFSQGEFKRLGKNGKEIWINASYNPVTDHSGKVVKIIKFATDITKSKLVTAEYEGKIAAISRPRPSLNSTSMDPSSPPIRTF